MADFSINDRRGRSKAPSTDYSASRLTREGIRVRHVTEADQRGGSSGLPFGPPGRRPTDEQTLNHMRSQRINGTRRHSSMATGTNSLQLATSRPRDPMWYWKQNNIPFNFTEPAELQKIREFCNTPDAPISMADGTFKPIGEIVAGDMVWGWTYLLSSNGGLHRQFTPTKVLATNTRYAPTVRLHLASGATVDCTPDHQWANPNFTKHIYENRGAPRPTHESADEYRVASVGAELLGVSNFRNVSNNVYGNARNFTFGITDSLTDKVISIEELPGGPVVSMQTGTGNYVAWGYASKNCRLLYVTHPIISACIDVYSKLPMQGMSFECKDPQLVDFYSDLFFDQLKYEEFLLKMGRQYWLSGESWALGGWNDTLGIWEADQLISPDDVEVEKSLFLNEPRYLMRLPESLRKVLTTRTPHWQYAQLVDSFPELLNYAAQDALMPVSNIILKQMRFEADDFSNRGIPILMRGFRTIIQEEMLNSALDSIADRLYTPLILTKLGATAQDLGTTVPWVPNQDEMEEFNMALDAALAADFRALTYHWAIDMQPVFGKENVPDLSNDFDRITERLLMVFGLSQTMLTGASAGETYAADALNRDVVTQLLSHYQKMLKTFTYERAAIVAEAQEHFDYDVRSGHRYLVTEEIYEVDEESGEGRIVEQPKLLVPELQFKVLNISDEEAERQFIESLAEAGVPIPYRARVATTGLDFDEMVEQRSQEAVSLVVAEQETRKKTYVALQTAGLPIADDLKEDFGPKAVQAQQDPMMMGQPGMDPAMGGEPGMPGQPPLPGMMPPGTDGAQPALGDTPLDLPMLAPSPDDVGETMDDENAPADNQDADDDGVGDTDEGGEPSNRPEESDEERKDMPKKKGVRTASIRRLGIREVTNRHYVAPDNSEEDPDRPQDWQPTGRFGTPRHVSMRRFVEIPEELKLSTYERGHGQSD